MSFEDVFWLIGWLEAEGCFGRTQRGRAPFIAGESKDEDTIDRVCSLLECNKYSVKPRNQKWNQTFRFRVERRELGTFLANAKRFMSARRQQQIATALEQISSDEIEDLGWHESLKTKYFVCWLAGYLEGEGSFLAGPPSDPNMSRIQLQTTDEDVAIEISAYFGVKYHRAKPKEGCKTPFCIAKRGSEAVRLMKAVFPLMSRRRQEQIQVAIKAYKVTPQRIPHAKFSQSDIEAIKAMRAGKMTVRRIAAYYNVSHPVISRICNGQSYVSTNVVRGEVPPALPKLSP